jgi:hypothetical protein
MSAAMQLRPNTLLRDADDGAVYSFRHRACDAMDDGLYDFETAAHAVAGLVDRGVLQVVELEPDVKTCRECGCTEDYACEVDGRPCRWVLDVAGTTLLLCTACAESRS